MGKVEKIGCICWLNEMYEDWGLGWVVRSAKMESGIVGAMNDRTNVSAVVTDKDMYERVSQYEKKIFRRRRMRVEERK